ncbi:MAG: hypothetical protein KKD05_10355 [Candidatus Omnitrophica bacterium]|nr:hypothetical protein [Candidatus Omnitrophota bacterium]
MHKIYKIILILLISYLFLLPNVTWAKHETLSPRSYIAHQNFDSFLTTILAKKSFGLVPGFPEHLKVSYGLSDDEAQLLGEYDNRTAKMLGCTVKKTKEKDFYVGFGYAHAKQKHGLEFEELGGFDACLKKYLQKEGILIPSRDNFLSIHKITDPKTQQPLYLIIVTNSRGRLQTFYTADEVPSIDELSQKSILSTIESLAANLTIPVYVTLENDTLYIKVFETIDHSYLIKYDRQKNSLEISVEILGSADFKTLTDKCQKIQKTETIRKRLAKLKKDINVNNCLVNLTNLEKGFEEIQSIRKHPVFTKTLSKKLVKEIIAKQRSSYPEKQNIEKTMQSPIDQIRESDNLFNELLLWYAGNFGGNNLLRKYTILKNFQQNCAGSYPAMLKFLEMLEYKQLDLPLLESRYLLFKEYAGENGLVFFRQKLPELFGRNKFGTPKMDEKEFLEFLKKIQPERYLKANRYFLRLLKSEHDFLTSVRSDPEKLDFLENILIHFALGEPNAKKSIVKDNFAFHNLNNPKKTKKSFLSVLEEIRDQPQKAALLNTMLMDKTGVSIEEIKSDAINFSVYADEIAQCLYDYSALLRKRYKQDHLQADRIDSCISSLYARKGQGIEFELLKRNLDEIRIGDIFGDCTAEGNEWFFQYLYYWFPNPDFEILKIYHNNKLVMRMHLVKTTLTENDWDLNLLVIDGIESIPSLRANDEEHADTVRMRLKEEIFETAMLQLKDHFFSSFDQVFAWCFSSDKELSVLLKNKALPVKSGFYVEEYVAGGNKESGLTPSWEYYNHTDHGLEPTAAGNIDGHKELSRSLQHFQSYIANPDFIQLVKAPGTLIDLLHSKIAKEDLEKLGLRTAELLKKRILQSGEEGEQRFEEMKNKLKADSISPAKIKDNLTEIMYYVTTYLKLKSTKDYSFDEHQDPELLLGGQKEYARRESIYDLLKKELENENGLFSKADFGGDFYDFLSYCDNFAYYADFLRSFVGSFIRNSFNNRNLSQKVFEDIIIYYANHDDFDVTEFIANTLLDGLTETLSDTPKNIDKHKLRKIIAGIIDLINTHNIELTVSNDTLIEIFIKLKRLSSESLAYDNEIIDKFSDIDTFDEIDCGEILILQFLAYLNHDPASSDAPRKRCDLPESNFLLSVYNDLSQSGVIDLEVTPQTGEIKSIILKWVALNRPQQKIHIDLKIKQDGSKTNIESILIEPLRKTNLDSLIESGV